MKRDWFLPALGAAAAMSCGDSGVTAVIPLNLDRPVDIAFACYGNMRLSAASDPTQPIIQTAQPPFSCEYRSPQTSPRGITSTPSPPPPGQDGIQPGTIGEGGVVAAPPIWYGFILQSASGTVAVAQFPAEAADALLSTDVLVDDADQLTPGKNAISVGEDPVAIATDVAGCYEVTANAGSCDLSELEINSALDDIPPVAGQATGVPSTPIKVERVPVHSQAGVPLLARPAAMVAQPSTTALGLACPATATGLVYIAYPGCHLVAGIDLATGTVVSGISFASAGPRLLSTAEVASVTCPDECTSASGTLGQGTATDGVRPVALDLGYDARVNTSLLAIGAVNSASLTVVDLDPATSRPVQVRAPIRLEDKTGTLGISVVAVSPQMTMGGANGMNNDQVPTADLQGQYVYAVASDRTVRVADVLTKNTECDTQVDTRFVRNIGFVSSLACFPVGAADTPPRRSGARGPGIELPGDGVPTSVAIIKGLNSALATTSTDDVTSDVPPTASTLIGYFAIVTASTGTAYVVNVDDDNAPDLFSRSNPFASAPVLTMAHQLRDSFFERAVLATDPTNDTTNTPTYLTETCSASDPLSDTVATATLRGGPRSTTGPVRNLPAGTIPSDKALELPTLRQLSCTSMGQTNPEVISELQYGNLLPVRDEVYPDLRNTLTESWTMTWEGSLSLDGALNAIDGPQVRTATMVVDSFGMSLRDQSRPFCNMGVEPFDLVEFKGCNPVNGNADCPLGYTCFVHPDSSSAVAGIGACMASSDADRLANACKDFLTSFRRYTVARAETGQLVLWPRKHELTTTPVDGCTDDAQCKTLADYAAQVRNDRDPLSLLDAAGRPTVVDTHAWACMADDMRAPINADPARNKRCVETCNKTADCDGGSICKGAVLEQAIPGICMESVLPPQACVAGPQHYAVRASEAFTVIGSRSGYVHPIIAKGGTGADAESCIRDPSASPIQIGRVPLQAPACDPAADPITGKLASGAFEPNPCSLTLTQVENEPTYPNLDVANRSCGTATVKVATERPTPADAIKFRNRAMTVRLVDPTYPGDKNCILDRQGGLGRIPLVVQGFQLSFDQKAGYTPMTLSSIGPVYPVKVVRGPSNSIWVLDDGDFLSTSITSSPTRGRVYRVESENIQLFNLLE